MMKTHHLFLVEVSCTILLATIYIFVPTHQWFIQFIACSISMHALYFIKRLILCTLWYVFFFPYSAEETGNWSFDQILCWKEALISNGTLRYYCTNAKWTNNMVIRIQLYFLMMHQEVVLRVLWQGKGTFDCQEASSHLRELCFFQCVWDHHCKELLDGRMIFLFAYVIWN